MMKSLGSIIACLCLQQSVLAAELLSLPVLGVQASYQLANNPDESLVVVSGTVFAAANNQSPAAANVTVRFWQPDSPGIYVSAVTDENGVYRIGLTEGVWRGEACGSGTGYSPAAWQVLIENKTLKQLQALSTKDIRIDIATPDNLVNAGDVVELSGQGFGCNGTLQFVYSNTVAINGDVGDVEYDHLPIPVENFSLRTDSRLRFTMPELAPDLGNSILFARKVGKVFYQQGNLRSNSIVLAQHLHDIKRSAQNQPSTLGSNVEVYGGSLDVEQSSGDSDLGQEPVLQEDNPAAGVSVHGGTLSGGDDEPAVFSSGKSIRGGR